MLILVYAAGRGWAVSAISFVPIMYGLLLAVLGGFALLVGYQLVTGQMRLSGLLSDASGATDPLRLQMLALTLGTLGTYAGLTLAGGVDGRPPDRLADVPDWLLAVLAGSQSIYLSGKVVGSNR